MFVKENPDREKVFRLPKIKKRQPNNLMNTWINNKITNKANLQNEISFSDEIRSYIKGPNISFFWGFLLSLCRLFRGVFRSPVDTGRKLNVHKTFRRRLTYVQLTSCVYGEAVVDVRLMFDSVDIRLGKCSISF